MNIWIERPIRNKIRKIHFGFNSILGHDKGFLRLEFYYSEGNCKSYPIRSLEG